MDVDTAFKDQLDAEYRDAERLVPTQRNRRLWSKVKSLAVRAFDQDDDTDLYTVGPIPVLRYNGYSATVQRRDIDRAVSSAVPLERCSYCHEAMANLTPFWVNAGPVVVQLELCRPCALFAIDALGAEPQISFDDLLNSR